MFIYIINLANNNIVYIKELRKLKAKLKSLKLSNL